jgi:hypothetical protein
MFHQVVCAKLTGGKFHPISVHENVFVTLIYSTCQRSFLSLVVLIMANVVGSVLIITVLEHYFSKWQLIRESQRVTSFSSQLLRHLASFLGTATLLRSTEPALEK